jgi:cytochrome c oxidase subunit 2
MILAQHGHSALNPASADAAAIGRMFDFMVVTATIVFVLVVAAALWAAWRRRALDEDRRSAERERSAHKAIIAAISATVVVLFVTLIYDLAQGRSLISHPKRDMLTIRLTGHQWWWEVEYEDSVAQNRVRTANEIRLPVGRRVLLKLDSRDVIHSFWAPNIGGKKDLIPGHPNELSLEVSRAGVYRAPCAEFCGLQHANMSLYVVAEDEVSFASWITKQRVSVAPSPDTLAARGQLVFETTNCATCHTVRGTKAGGTVGPDLTHVASRRTIAAGTLSNTRANLAGWIVDPQRIKPGVYMPSNALDPGDFRAIVAYVSALR